MVLQTQIFFQVGDKWFCKIGFFFRLQKCVSANSDFFFWLEKIGSAKSDFFLVGSLLRLQIKRLTSA